MTDPQETTDEATTEAPVAEEISAPTEAATPEGTPTPDETTTPVVTAEAAPPEEPRRAAKRRQILTPRELAPYAVIETGGKQYRVSVGDILSVEKLDQEAGADITFDRVLLVGGDGTTRVGTPTVTGATVSATIQEQYRGEKLVIFKYKPKKRYRRRTGHRQSLTRLAITAINA
jgi:large subunit ribosomal protein L21